MGAWRFLESTPDRPAGGDAFRRMFSRLDPEIALAREAIQNAVDAADDKSRDDVRIEFELHDDCPLEEFLGEVFSRHATAKSFVDPDLNLPISAVTRSQQVLLISDYGTTGLTGDMRTTRSNFYRLMGGLGGSEKAEGGGSYGFGKAAAILNSKLLTVFVYTVTHEPDEESKLWGTCYLDPHRLNGKDYLGVGWFCDERSEDRSPLLVEGEQANRLASLLKIDRVKSRAVGTTIALIGPSTDLELLAVHIRRNWWPKISERTNDASRPLVCFRNGTTRKIISLGDDKGLGPYISAYEVARGLREPTPSIRKFELSQNSREGKIRLGTLVLSYDPLGDVGDDLLDGIAFVRNPRMVVSYYRYNGFPAGMRGVFVADQGMDSFLRKTEPHEHDDWNEKIGGESLDRARKYAAEVKKQIRLKVRDLANGYVPPPASDAKLLPELRRMLGNLFDGSGTGRPSPGADPISITKKTCKPIASDGGLILQGEAQFTNTDRRSREVEIGVCVQITESDLGGGGDLIAATICVDGKTNGPNERPSLRTTLGAGEGVRLEFETGAYDLEWTTRATFWAEAAKD